MAVIKDEYSVDGKDFSIFIEVDDESLRESPYEGMRGGKEKIINYTKDLLGDGLVLTRHCAARVVENLKQIDLTLRPNEFEVQFSIKLDSSVGAIITQSTLGAQLQVKMKWIKKEVEGARENG